jgi:hypothetical protein
MEVYIMGTIPAHLLQDREWGAMLHLFLNCPNLNCYLTTQYFDFQSCSVKVAALKRLAGPWSQAEKFMLNLAFHCYNNRNKVDLGDMDYLDPNNRQLAFEALQKRYGRR